MKYFRILHDFTPSPNASYLATNAIRVDPLAKVAVRVCPDVQMTGYGSPPSYFSLTWSPWSSQPLEPHTRLVSNLEAILDYPHINLYLVLSYQDIKGGGRDDLLLVIVGILASSVPRTTEDPVAGCLEQDRSLYSLSSLSHLWGARHSAGIVRALVPAGDIHGVAGNVSVGHLRPLEGLRAVNGRETAQHWNSSVSQWDWQDCRSDFTREKEGESSARLHSADQTDTDTPHKTILVSHTGNTFMDDWLWVVGVLTGSSERSNSTSDLLFIIHRT